ncbi:MAG: VacJ family lipoprotein [Limnohabitans sp.]|nr:VacJ family lipoprotein [Limnohabitans sp.]
MPFKKTGVSGCYLALLTAAVLTACAIDPAANPQDPYESTNRSIYEFNEQVDAKLVWPVAVSYQKNVPEPVQTGMGNFFGNLKDIWSTLNNALQARPMDTVETGLRVAVNTVFGIYGIFDVATWAGLQRHTADFGETLGVWGVPSGPYLVLPLLGPSTARDTVGWTFDNYYNLWNGVDPIGLRYSGTAVRVVHTRAGYLDMDTSLNEVALDKYSFLRDAYLQRRNPKGWRRNLPADMQGNDGSDGSDGSERFDGESSSESVNPKADPVAATVASADEVPVVIEGPPVTYERSDPQGNNQADKPENDQ